MPGGRPRATGSIAISSISARARRSISKACSCDAPTWPWSMTSSGSIIATSEVCSPSPLLRGKGWAEGLFQIQFHNALAGEHPELLAGHVAREQQDAERDDQRSRADLD